MSGPKQHYIPVLLQKAFRIGPKKPGEIWLFSRGEAPERRPVKQTGLERHFYSEPGSGGERTLDDAITAFELTLSAQLNDVRCKAPGDRVKPDVAATIVTHLATRTAHVRSTLAEAVERLLERAGALFAEPESVASMMGLDSDVPTDRFRDLVSERLASAPEIAGLGVPARLLERLAFALLKENWGEFAGRAELMAAALVDSVRPRSDELVRESHNGALARIEGEGGYAARLRSFHWAVAPAAGAILPDCVVLVVGEDGVANTYLFGGGEQLGAVVLAVSPDQLLVGRRPGFTVPEAFDYNIEAAKLSRTFFLASRNDAETKQLHAMVGERYRAELTGSIDDAVTEFRPPEEYEPERDVEIKGAWQKDGFEWQLSLVGCGDEEASHRIGDQVRAVVQALSLAMPLDRLDGVTVGYDYPALLRSVDHGYDGAPQVETVSPEIGVGIAHMVTVMRASVVKGRIVLSGTVADALVHEDPGVAAWGVHVLVKQLARVVMVRMVDEALPGHVLHSVESGIEGWLFAPVDGVSDAYVASWMAAGFGDARENAEGLRSALAESVERMTSVSAKARNVYVEDSDMEALLGAVLPFVRQVLSSAADLLGHCACTGESPHDESGTLDEALDGAGLVRWLDVYGEHLARFHRRLGRWESFDEFLAFNIHAERVLWSAGLFPWESPEGLQAEVAPHRDVGVLLGNAFKAGRMFAGG